MDDGREKMSGHKHFWLATHVEKVLDPSARHIIVRAIHVP